MNWRFIFLFLGMVYSLLSSMDSQTSALEKDGPVYVKGEVLGQPTYGKPRFFQVRELLATKTKVETQKNTTLSSHGQDSSIAGPEIGASMGTELPTGISHDNAIANNSNPFNQDGHLPRTPYPSPPMGKQDGTAEKTDERGNKTDHGDSVAGKGEVESVDDNGKSNSSDSETSAQKSVEKCGGNYCEDPKKMISACLSTPGDRAYKLSLLITYEGDTDIPVKVIAPKFIKAEAVDVSMSKGKSETIQLTIDSNYKMDSEATQNNTIFVTSVYGHCEIQIPMEYLHEERPHILPSLDARVISYLLLFVLATSCAGAWLCYKCHSKKRAGEVKYQHLEMNEIGQTRPKERDGEANSSWNEVWDDNWEDTEAAKPSSRLGQSLSSRGMVVRRGTKDGWDNSWED